MEINLLTSEGAVHVVWWFVFVVWFISMGPPLEINPVKTYTDIAPRALFFSPSKPCTHGDKLFSATNQNCFGVPLHGGSRFLTKNLIIYVKTLKCSFEDKTMWLFQWFSGILQYFWMSALLENMYFEYVFKFIDFCACFVWFLLISKIHCFLCIFCL